MIMPMGAAGAPQSLLALAGLQPMAGPTSTPMDELPPLGRADPFASLSPRRRLGMFGRGVASAAAAPQSEPSGEIGQLLMTGQSPPPQGDLAEALAVLQRDAEPPQPGTISTPRRIAGIVSDALAGMTGQPPRFAQYVQQFQRDQSGRVDAWRKAQHDNALQVRDRAWSLEDAQRKANAPDYFMSGQDRVKFDPATGSASVVYDAPDPYENYASALGYAPGTPEYTKAMQDYVLRSSGPTAFDYDTQLDDLRTTNDMRLDDRRTVNDTRQKAAPTYRDSHGAPPRAAGRPASPRAVPTATNAQGQKVEYRDGKWQPAR